GLLAGEYTRHALGADVIVPVPLTGLRRRQRGYNQAALMARELSKALDIPAADALSRRGHAKPQAGPPSAEQRRRNVEGVFSVAKPDAIAGSHVLLIDDVATTGATISACAEVLLEAGAAAVSALTLARED